MCDFLALGMNDADLEVVNGIDYINDLAIYDVELDKFQFAG